MEKNCFRNKIMKKNVQKTLVFFAIHKRGVLNTMSVIQRLVSVRHASVRELSVSQTSNKILNEAKNYQ